MGCSWKVDGRLTLIVGRRVDVDFLNFRGVCLRAEFRRIEPLVVRLYLGSAHDGRALIDLLGPGLAHRVDLRDMDLVGLGH